MKTMKRIIALLCAVGMALALTACGGESKEEIAQILADAQAKVAAAGNMEAEMLMDMNISVTEGEGAEPQVMDTVLKMRFIAFENPLKVKMNIDMSGLSAELGEAAEGLTVDTYVVEQDGIYTVYTNSLGAWTTQTVDLSELGQLNPQDNLQLYIENASSFTRQGEETLESGVKAVKYSGVITGESMDKVMEASGMLGTVQGLGIEGLDLAALYAEMEDMPISIWIDSEGYPVRYEMDMTAMMNTVYQKLLAQFGDEAAGVEMTASKVKVSMDMSNYGTAEDFELPPEALQ